MNHHNSKLIQTNMENATDHSLPRKPVNEEFPSIICFDSLSSKTEKKLSTVKRADNTSIVEYEVCEFIYRFLNHL